MDIRRIIAVALAAIAAALPAQAQQASDSITLASSDTTRQFQQRTVTAAARLSLEGSTAAGSRAFLQIDMDSGIAGDWPEEHAHSGLINGILAVALPAGIEFAGEPRLYYFDPATGDYAFMYSNTLEQKPWLPDLSQPLSDASSTDPNRIYQGITELNRVLDKRITTVLPADPRVQGRDPRYSLAGKSWIIPCSVLFSNLTDLFEPEQSLVKNASLRMSVPVRFTSEYSGAEIAVYAGFLSTAVARVTMLPSEIPPGAIILVEQAEQEAPVAEATDGAAAEPGAAAEAAGQEPAAAGDTPPTEGQETAAETVEPQPVEALIYSFEWFSWETTSNLQPQIAGAAAAEDILTTQTPAQPQMQASGEIPVVPGSSSKEGEAVTVGAPAGTESPPAAAQPEDGAPVRIDISELPESTAGGTADEAGESVDVMTIGEAQPVRPVAEPAIPQQAPQQPPIQPGQPQQTQTESEATPAVQQPVEQQPAAAGEPGVVEIAPGTLPVEEEYYVVPLKPITGSGRGGQAAAPGGSTLPPGMPGTAPGMPLQAPGISAGQFVPPSDLGEMVLVPEGYFLMGTSNTSSAGDQDELPQSQVYLPAYYIDKHLVTNRQFYAFVVSSGYKPQGSWDKYYDQGTADMPVRGVAWEDASAYARWVGKRLPSEAEWEKAARGTDGRLYPWGDEWSSEILPRGDFVFNLVHAQGALSPYGCQSMVGVLWQWTASGYGPYPYNPDTRSDDKVLRGGCYSNGRNIIRCANRYAEPFNVALNTFGFRCARDA